MCYLLQKLKIFTILKITQMLNFVNRCELNFAKYSKIE
nr:MAG TPA: hypothetical protein [Caudoviricetes sp.]